MFPAQQYSASHADRQPFFRGNPVPSFAQSIVFFKKNWSAFIVKARLILSFSPADQQRLAEDHPAAAGKIKILSPSADDLFQAIDWQQKERVKEKYTGGKEFFLFVGEVHPGHHLVDLLKALSFFKRRQKSNMQLVIASIGGEVQAFADSLKTYKFRQEVVLLNLPSQQALAELLGAAYAFVYPAAKEGIAVLPLLAMQTGVPVIATDLPAIREMAGDAGLYIDPANSDDIAAKMMLLFKDEGFRTELIKKGFSRLREEKTTAGSLPWQSLLTTIS